jgi:hypothetical protein
MWSCDTCGRPNKSNPIICETCGAAAPGADESQVSLALQRDLSMEAHLRALAFWYRVGAVLMVVFGVALVGLTGFIGSAFLGESPLHRSGAMFAGVLGYMMTFMLAAAAGSWVLGHFLSRFANGARLAAAILTLVSLGLVGVRFVLTAVLYSRMSSLYGDNMYFARPSLAGPIASFLLSTIWMIAIAWTLFSSRAAQVCAPTYRTIVARTATMKAPMVKSPFFVIPLVGTILVVLMSLMLFARLHSY